MENHSYLFIPRRLKLIRFYYDLSLQEMADIVGISKQAMSKYENGLMSPSIIIQVGLCTHFKLPNDYFTKHEIIIKLTGTKITL